MGTICNPDRNKDNKQVKMRRTAGESRAIAGSGYDRKHGHYEI